MLVPRNREPSLYPGPPFQLVFHPPPSAKPVCACNAPLVTSNLLLARPTRKPTRTFHPPFPKANWSVPVMCRLARASLSSPDACLHPNACGSPRPPLPPRLKRLYCAARCEQRYPRLTPPFQHACVSPP
ncbi:unnamed protein product, partial [Laminaria digitata]